jgi:hypothetical protein
MKILKFIDFVSNEVLYEEDSVTTTPDQQPNKTNYKITYEGIEYDFTDLFTNYINKIKRILTIYRYLIFQMKILLLGPYYPII